MADNRDNYDPSFTKKANKHQQSSSSSSSSSSSNNIREENNRRRHQGRNSSNSNNNSNRNSRNNTNNSRFRSKNRDSSRPQKRNASERQTNNNNTNEKQSTTTSSSTTKEASESCSTAAPVVALTPKEVCWQCPRNRYFVAGEGIKYCYYVPLKVEQAMIGDSNDTNDDSIDYDNGVLLRWYKTESGMMRDQPSFRWKQIEKACYRTGMTASQALSLRRHHIKLLHPYRSMEQLRLGRKEDIDQSAKIFEQLIETFLQTQDIHFYTEKQQQERYHNNNYGNKNKNKNKSKQPKQKNNNSNDNNTNHHIDNNEHYHQDDNHDPNDNDNDNDASPSLGKKNKPKLLTPDFLFHEDQHVTLKQIWYDNKNVTTTIRNSYNSNNRRRDQGRGYGGRARHGGGRGRGGGGHYSNGNHNNDNDDNSYSNSSRATVSKRIFWIEAKMFYGASTIPHDNHSAVGNILSKAREYVATHGRGVYAFKSGCGERLAKELWDVGVIALDCTDNHTNHTANTVATNISLDLVRKHQQTWCANEDGKILP